MPKKQKGNYLLLHVNNAVQHLKTHHPGANSSFVCSRCGKVYKTKHAAQCHLPKCPGVPEVVNDGITCEACGQIFKTQRGLSQHERTAHPESRNQKRKDAAQPAQPRPEAKGYGKIWSKEDIDLMIQLEQQLKGHPRIAKEMTAHFPGKTAKQIRDKRREGPYKKLLQALFEPTNEQASSPPDTQDNTSETTLQELATNPSSPRAATSNEQDPETPPNHIADWEIPNIGKYWPTVLQRTTSHFLFRTCKTTSRPSYKKCTITVNIRRKTSLIKYTNCW